MDRSVNAPAVSPDLITKAVYYAGSDGRYWSSSLVESYMGYAWTLNFYSGGVWKYDRNRDGGQSVRPVRKN